MADANGGFYEHFEETDPDLFAQFSATFVEPTFKRDVNYPLSFVVCSRCFAVVPCCNRAEGVDGRQGHLSWHRETSAVLYVFGSGIRALHEPERTDLSDDPEASPEPEEPTT